MRSRRPLILSPSRWPVRWRLAGVSAGLTFAILLVFATIVGRLGQERLESDFRNDLEATANELAFSVSVNPITGEPNLAQPELERFTFGSDATISVVDASGRVFGVANERPLPPPRPGTVRFGDLEVATRPVISNSLSQPLFVQYARDHEELDATIGRFWLFLGIGVGAGALLATLAGLWIAGRAMRPIAALTATAREIASTRDPSRTLPEPAAEDEVAELARTLDSMLAELDASRTESEQMMQAQRDFVADASHELRTPLTSVLANLELLQERLEGGREGDDLMMVESALRSSQRMRRLVGDLLLLARADAGRLGARHACDLAEIAEAAVSEVRPIANGRAIGVRAEGPVSVEGNPDELHRLAVNLLDNAVRHTPGEATVEVTVSRADDVATLEVADDGPGIPAEVADQVFSRFVRGGGAADLAADAGTGLGLAIVRAVAESHGGGVVAGRSDTGGARFTVTLPVTGSPTELPGKVSANV